ncbi:Serine/threonine-protein phosphatase [Nymphaea thermarum]|nr:Serine/threonine-protein phosphatase [Nymphaea thermarum]
MDVDSAAVPERDQQDGQNQSPGQSQSASASVPSQSLHGEREEQLPSHQQQQQQPHSGPAVGSRPAPTYSVVNAVIEKKEDGPGPRCGHTLTAVAAVGGRRIPRLCWSSSNTGNSAISGPPSSGASTGIRLVGATADVHCYYNAFEQMVKHNVSNVNSKINVRLSPLGEPPSPRAAHVATAVGTMVVIQGGIGPTGLSAEDLHVLDLTQQRPRWHRVVVQGAGPGPRYGHVMALVGQRFLLAIGGNDDVWALDTAAKPYEWRKLEPEGEGPPPCMYATASARSDGLLLLCGGRDANNDATTKDDPLKLREIVLSGIEGALEAVSVVEHTDLNSIMCSPPRYRSPWTMLWGHEVCKGKVTVTGDAMQPMTPDIG